MATKQSLPDRPGSSREQAVRFSSKLQEIEPQHSLHLTETLTPEDVRPEPIRADAQAELHNLALSLEKSRLQQGRLSNFAFEPVSLPPSRVPSTESSSRQSYDSTTQRRAPSTTSIHTPPLTPAGSAGRDIPKITPEAPSFQMTPQTSGLQDGPSVTSEQPRSLSGTTISSRQRPSSSGQISTRPTTMSSETRVLGATSPKHGSMFFPGPAGESSPPSREESPAETPAPGSGSATPPLQYTKPFQPSGDKDDPYARSKRPPQPRNLDSIDARFIFGGKESRRHSSFISQGALGQLPRSSIALDWKSPEKPNEKNQSSLSVHKKDHDESSTSTAIGNKHSSMADLKRFLRFGHSSKRTRSPAPSKNSHKSGSMTPPNQQTSTFPFADDHGLQSKYGKFGKVLGSGAGGSVRLMKRSSDGVTFAVKQFRDRHNYETEREYAKKVTAEFCIGSTLHHGNIIETLDIVQERGHWYEVMEYAPFDLFATVMTGKMSREEIACSFLQIFSGVTYLHNMGLAHRDLKLDNVVVNEHGIMKIIDFGSAIVCRYPFENDIVLATGVVGSDPYLAPEVYDNTRYDPQATDIWSLAIIFACMSLRRFPWKIPRVTDNSYKLFVSISTPGTPSAEGGPRRSSEQRPRSLATDDPASPTTDRPCADDASTKPAHRHQHHRERSGPSDSAPVPADGTSSKPEVIRGPWRLLRLLPRESRNIIGRMLEVDPKKRATIEDMLRDPWVSSAAVCQQVEHGRVIKATGHTHTLEPGSSDSAAPSRK